jgi:HSP20 family protein
MNNLIPWRRSEVRNTNEMQPVSHMRWDWDRLFDRILDDRLVPSAHSTSGWPLDVSGSEEQIRVRVEVPGVMPDDIDISLTGDVLTVSGKKVEEDDSDASTLYYTERGFGAFQRAITLPCAVDPDKVSAEHRNGVVTITLQKSEAVRPKRIKVNAASK